MTTPPTPDRYDGSPDGRGRGAIAVDTVALREVLVGSGRTMACCHPDVLDIELSHNDRKCVLDIGRPQDCDIAEYDHYKTKEACPYWQSVALIVPRQLSIDEGLALIDALEAALTRAPVQP